MHLHNFKWQHGHKCKFFRGLSILVTQNVIKSEKDKEKGKVKLLSISFLAESKHQIRRVKDSSHEIAPEEKQAWWRGWEERTGWKSYTRSRRKGEKGGKRKKKGESIVGWRRTKGESIVGWRKTKRDERRLAEENNKTGRRLNEE